MIIGHFAFTFVPPATAHKIEFETPGRPGGSPKAGGAQ
jgi:hypothetical protein